MHRALVLLPLLVLAGCGGNGGEESAQAPEQTIAVSETEYSIMPTTMSVPKAGTVEFKVTNNGQTGHALEIEGHGVEEETDTIDPGSSATLTVDLKDTGSYEVYCPIDDHKDKGMKATLTVGAATGPGVGGTTTAETETEGTTTTQTTTSTTSTTSPGY